MSNAETKAAPAKQDLYSPEPLNENERLVALAWKEALIFKENFRRMGHDESWIPGGPAWSPMSYFNTPHYKNALRLFKERPSTNLDSFPHYDWNRSIDKYNYFEDKPKEHK